MAMPDADEWLALSGAPAFEQVLRQRPAAKSAHFAIHCLRSEELSTGPAQGGAMPVDDLPRRSVGSRAGPGGAGALPRLGLVVPKRHARRAVTRNLVKRQARAAWHLWWHDVHREAALARTDWVVRLRGPIDRKQFVSARSEALAALLRDELRGLFATAARRVGWMPKDA
jgi:ribonuclease P protein component